jgi:hypothetical protein
MAVDEASQTAEADLNRERQTAKVWSKQEAVQTVETGLNSVEDPDPDPHVFGPPGSGSGSTSQRYGSGSGSFYHHAQIVKKTLIPTIL